MCKKKRLPIRINTPAFKTNTHIEVLPPSVYALRGIIFYTVAKINENLMLYDFKVNAIIYR